MSKSTLFSKLVLPAETSANNILTLVRDFTDAGDGIPFLLHISKSISIVTPPENILFISTRSRTSFNSQDAVHVYPAPSRAMGTATAAFLTLDPYKIQKPDFSVSDAQMQKSLTLEAATIAREKKCTVVAIECIHALKMVFGVDPSAFVRSLLLPELQLNVIASCPTQCGIDEDICSLSDIADAVIDLSDLKTGVAADVDGTMRIAKEGGRWQPRNTWNRYFVTDAALKIHI